MKITSETFETIVTDAFQEFGIKNLSLNEINALQISKGTPFDKHYKKISYSHRETYVNRVGEYWDTEFRYENNKKNIDIKIKCDENGCKKHLPK